MSDSTRRHDKTAEALTHCTEVLTYWPKAIPSAFLANNRREVKSLIPGVHVKSLPIFSTRWWNFSWVIAHVTLESVRALESIALYENLQASPSLAVCIVEVSGL